MLNAVKDLFNVWRRNERAGHRIPTHVNQTSGVVDQRVLADVEMNGAPMSVALPHASQSTVAPNFPNEPPPHYNETSITPNGGLEFPPTYDEAMAMKKQAT